MPSKYSTSRPFTRTLVGASASLSHGWFAGVAWAMLPRLPLHVTWATDSASADTAVTAPSKSELGANVRPVDVVHVSSSAKVASVLRAVPAVAPAYRVTVPADRPVTVYVTRYRRPTVSTAFVSDVVAPAVCVYGPSPDPAQFAPLHPAPGIVGCVASVTAPAASRSAHSHESPGCTSFSGVHAIRRPPKGRPIPIPMPMPKRPRITPAPRLQPQGSQR